MTYLHVHAHVNENKQCIVKKKKKRCVSLFKSTLLLGSNKMLFLINEEIVYSLLSLQG